ncbi:MAG: imidazole glycerol phosphate synthase subunit HisH [bacterium]|nr:imidazole glycerol phosphate synthase subunit HisH [bacterium]
MSEVMIIDTGIANVRSMEVALQRLGATTRLVADPDDLARAARVVLPGVGAFGPGLANLHTRNLASSLRQRALAGLPTLAVCLGLQLLCEGSDEAPGDRGLGVIPARVRRLPAAARVPNLGWCAVAGSAGDGAGAHAYFAHSYAVPGGALERLHAGGWQTLAADHGGTFLAAARRGGVLACQFHPELSGAWGARLLRAWLENAEQEMAPWQQ